MQIGPLLCNLCYYCSLVSDTLIHGEVFIAFVSVIGNGLFITNWEVCNPCINFWGLRQSIFSEFKRLLGFNSSSGRPSSSIRPNSKQEAEARVGCFRLHLAHIAGNVYLVSCRLCHSCYVKGFKETPLPRRILHRTITVEIWDV